MSARFLLIDLESVQPSPSDVVAWLGESGSAWVFHGPHQTKLLPTYSAIGNRVALVPISRPGKNSLDFHLVFYLGYLTARNPNAKFAVLSKDTGYDPAIAHALTLEFDLLRIEECGPKGASVASPGKAAVKSTAKKRVVPPHSPALKVKPASLGRRTQPMKRPAEVKKAVAKSVTQAANPLDSAKTETAKRSGAKDRTVAAVYRDVLHGLREHPSNRPQTRVALERYAQTMIGSEPSPEKARAIVDRLFTVEAVRRDGRKFVYFQKDPARSESKAR